MTTYALKRLLLALPVLWGVTLVAFLTVRISPGGPALAILGEKATAEKIAELNRINGWDKPLIIQYGRFLSDVFLRFDLGESYHRREKVSDELKQRFPATMELALAAMILSVLVGIPAGMLAAVRRNSFIDYVSMTGALFGVSVPVFFLGLLMIMTFQFLPGGGRLPITMDLDPITGFVPIDALLTGQLDVLTAFLKHLVLPSIALSTIPMAVIARMTRSSVLEVLGDDYIRTARAKGLRESVVILKHAFRAALIPIVTVVGLNFGYLLAGAVLTETVFDWPGIGQYIVHAVLLSDYNSVQGGILLVAGAFVLINLVVDLSYGVIDPRVRVS
ncbi:MAG: ABC transporter permease [Planctomycetota bacterium]|jgi:peptide/nickel transport system permease protein